jgi:hypothetical protein
VSDVTQGLSESQRNEAMLAQQRALPLFKLDDVVTQMTATMNKLFDKPSEASDKLIPLSMLQDCKALMFIKITKESFSVGTTLGVGCLLIRQENVEVRVHRDNEKDDQVKQDQTITGTGWSAPIAICLEAYDIGLKLEIPKSRHLIAVRSPRFLEQLLSLEKVYLPSLHLRISDAEKCLNAENPMVLNDEGLDADLIDFSMAKDAFLGETLRNQTMRVDLGVNANYYKQPFPVYEMLMAEPKTILPKERQEDWEKLVDVLRQAMDKSSYRIAKTV